MFRAIRHAPGTLRDYLIIGLAVLLAEYEPADIRPGRYGKTPSGGWNWFREQLLPVWLPRFGDDDVREAARWTAVTTLLLTAAVLWIAVTGGHPSPWIAVLPLGALLSSIATGHLLISDTGR